MAEGILNTGMTIYDLNEQIASKKEALTTEEKQAVIPKLNTWVNGAAMGSSKFIFAFCPKDNYITVFNRIPKNPKKVRAEERFGEQLVECLEAYGTIKSIDVLNDETAEAWVEREEKLNYVLIFDGSRGVVPFAG